MIERAKELIEKRLRNAALYAKRIKGRGKWMFVHETQDPISLSERLKENGIESRYVFPPLNKCPAFRQHTRGKFSVAERVWQTGLCLPTGPHLEEQDIERICEVVNGH